MESSLLSHLLDVSLRSLPLAMGAPAVLRIPRLRRAAWAHAVWTVVLLSMLLLFGLGPVLRPIRLRILPPALPTSVLVQQEIPSQGVRDLPELPPGTGERLSQGFVPAPPQPAKSAGAIALWVYASITAALLAHLLVGSWLARRLLAGSVRAGENFYESPRIAVPLTLGWVRPVILLPSSWRTWDQKKLDAVLTHESSHVRRRDSLISFFASVNRCLFWFHPLAWWMERRLAFLAEQACDEACVCALEDRSGYARLLLEMAGAVMAAGGRVPGRALAMARPSQVHRRIDAILDETRSAHPGLTRASWAAVLLCGIPIVYAAGSMHIEPKVSLQRPPIQTVVPAARPTFQPLNPPIPTPKPILVAQAATPAPPPPETPAAQSPLLFPVSVVEPAGRFVTGLRAGDFQIVTGQTTQPITTLLPTEGQHSVVVVNTTGGNNDAVDAFQKFLDSRDESFVAEGPAAENTDAFLDAIATAVIAVKQKQNPVKAVVVMMQGGGKNPLASERAVANVLRLALTAPRVTVSFANLEDTTKAVAAVSAAVSQQDDMRIIAGATGGQVIPVARPEEMTTALKRIALGLRSQYLLGFVPTGPLRPGTLGRMRVEAVQVNGIQLQVIGPQAYRLP